MGLCESVFHRGRTEMNWQQHLALMVKSEWGECHTTRLKKKNIKKK